MISLFLNTSSSLFNTCLVKDGKLIDSVCESFGKDLSKEALYKITIMLENNDISLDDIDEIICVSGPGSFTGLRIGVTIAKTMAYFLKKDLFSTSSLNVMATSVTGDIIVPLIDARRGYVYSAIYDKNYDILMEDSYIKLDELLEKVKSYSGNVSFVSLDKFDFETVIFKPNFENFYKFGKKEKVDSMTFVPNYLKKTEAEEKLNDKGN